MHTKTNTVHTHTHIIMGNNTSSGEPSLDDATAASMSARGGTRQYVSYFPTGYSLQCRVPGQNSMKTITEMSTVT